MKKKEFIRKYGMGITLISLIMIVGISIIYTQPQPNEPACNLNVTEYWYWNNETKQGYIITDPETNCRLVSIYGEVENRAYYYYCDNVMEGFSHELMLTNPETDYKMIKTFKKCIRW